MLELVKVAKYFTTMTTVSVSMFCYLQELTFQALVFDECYWVVEWQHS